MAHHEPETMGNDVKERLLLPILLPIVSLLVTVALIVIIGEFLLAFGESSYTLVGQHVVLPVFLALGLALIFLGAATFAARRWGADDT